MQGSHGTVGSGTEGSLTENVFGLICCLQRKLPAAGSHAEIRQAFICSAPACLEKYVINASKSSFIRVRLFFILFYFDFFFPWHEQCWQQNLSWRYLEWVCALRGLMVGHTHYPTFFSGGERGELNCVGFVGWWRST